MEESVAISAVINGKTFRLYADRVEGLVQLIAKVAGGLFAAISVPRHGFPSFPFGFRSNNDWFSHLCPGCAAMLLQSRR